MEISAGGKVIINNLSGTGTRSVYSTSTGVLTNTSSDIRLKTNIKPLTQAYDVISLLKDSTIFPVTFNWKSDSTFRDLGFIAQMFEKTVPEIIGRNSDGMLSLDYSKLTAILWAQNQKLLKRIEQLETKLETNIIQMEMC